MRFRISLSLSAILAAAAARADLNRVLVLRTASDFDSPTGEMIAAEGLARNVRGQFGRSCRRSKPPGPWATPWLTNWSRSGRSIGIPFQAATRADLFNRRLTAIPACRALAGQDNRSYRHLAGIRAALGR